MAIDTSLATPAGNSLPEGDRSEAADGQSADRSGSLQLPLLFSRPALRPGSHTTVTGEPASSSTQVEPHASGCPEGQSRQGLGQFRPSGASQLPSRAVHYEERLWATPRWSDRQSDSD
jgi:hypothetical protein